ncbi:MAG: FtsX-like permease family protein [Acidobacteria bacterium]|nr:FtsX-like permease family protein [Acidobacteriota bacterium]
MKGTSLARMAWRNLWRNRRRTTITLSAIVFGVFLAVILMATQDRNWADMIRLAARLGAGHVTIQHPEYLDSPTLTRPVEGTDELRRLAADNPRVIRVVERITGFNMLSTARENIGAGFIAVSPEDEDEETLSLLEAVVEGKFFESSSDGGIILGEKLASNLDVELGSKVVYTLTDKEGEIVSGLARVSGLIRTGSPSVDGGICLLPIDTVREAIGFGPDEAIQVAAFVDDQRVSDAVVTEIGSQAPESVAVLPWHELQPDLAVFIAMKVGGSKVIMLVLALLVAAGIFNTLFVSVMERLREFGIMLAVGFSPGQLFRLVMFESAWLAVVGLTAAALVTIGPYLYLASTGIDMSALVAADQMEVAGVGMSSVMRVGIYGESVALIGASALAAILLSGVYPAWRAGHADPVETIRLV